MSDNETTNTTNAAIIYNFLAEIGNTASREYDVDLNFSILIGINRFNDTILFTDKTKCEGVAEIPSWEILAAVESLTEPDLIEKIMKELLPGAPLPELVD